MTGLLTPAEVDSVLGGTHQEQPLFKKLKDDKELP